MWLKQLSIQHFRNYQELEVEFHPGLNIFLGQNAQGKTNILESIYFLALTRSHRTRNDRDLIYFESTDFKVSGQLQRETGPLPLEISLTPKGRITKVNHLKQAKLSNYIGHMNVVLFAPEDLQLIKGSPAGRRKFIDIELGQMKPLYLSDLSQYNHVLKQRNSYLKNSEKIDATFLEVLDSQLASFGSRVLHLRLLFFYKIKIKFGNEMETYNFKISNYYHDLHELRIDGDWDESEFKENVIAKTIFCLLRNAKKYLYSDEYDDFTYSLPVFKNKFEESYRKFANNEIRSCYNIRKIVLDIYDRVFSNKEKSQVQLKKLKDINVLEEFYDNDINSLLKDLFYLFGASEFIQISKKFKKGDIIQNSEKFLKKFIGNVLLKKKFVFNEVEIDPEYFFELIFQEEWNRELYKEKEIKKYYEAREKRLEKNKNE